MSRRFYRACVIVVCGWILVSTSALAQTGVSIVGQLVNSVSGELVGNVVVLLEELSRETRADADGTFTFSDVPPGSYHVSVRADGFSARRTEIVVGSSAVTQTVLVDPELHYTEVVSVSPESRSQFEAYQPTSVLAGQELTKQLEGSLGATLENQPGVASRSFGTATARPVIRGLSGDRVLILQDGQRMGDLSTQSADHAVTVNPAAAQRIEVVRGPATLLYGSNAIGGLVNVIADEIPNTPLERVTGHAIFDAGSAAKEGGAAADVRAGNGRVALHAGGGGRRSGDVSTPEGEVVNSQARSGFGNIGLSWTGSSKYVGGSYGYDDTKLGIPVVEGGILQSTPRKHSIGIRAGAHDLTGPFDSLRATLTVRRYKHEELEGADVGTAFKNDTSELEVLTSHRALGRLTGSFGAWVLDRAFDATGAEALSPAVDQRAFAAFVFEEVTWPHVTVQIGGRVDDSRYSPHGERQRSFTTGSGSAGLVFRPAAANDAITLAVSVARAARYPAIEELFYFGPHPGNFTFEIGNPMIGPEYALGVDLALRWRSSRASGEVAYFRNAISDYLFRSPVTEDAFVERLPEFADRFPDRGIGAPEGGGGEEEEEEEEAFPIIEYVAADSVLQGIEAHADLQLTARIAAELGLDYVHGSLKDTNEPLPLIPPLRFRGGLRYQYNAFQAGGEVTATARQDRVFRSEEPTDGYQLLRLFAAYSFQAGEALNTITGRVDNVTDTLYRSHLSYIKQLVPEMGRNFRLLYDVRF